VGSLLGGALAAELMGQLVEQLRWALEHGMLIEQAKGVLVGREGISTDAAYRRSRSVARSSRRPVAEVARTVVAGGRWGRASKAP
jgi:AmiR/NasT family two-component response regulator